MPCPCSVFSFTLVFSTGDLIYTECLLLTVRLSSLECWLHEAGSRCFGFGIPYVMRTVPGTWWALNKYLLNA